MLALKSSVTKHLFPYPNSCLLVFALHIQTMPNSNILVIMTHPDDIERLMGGTALLLKDRYQLHIVILSPGQHGFPPEGLKDPEQRVLSTEPREDTAALRRSEAQTAANMLNAKLTVLDHIDGDVFADRDTVEKITALMTTLKPRSVFTHWPFDKPDHSAAYQISMQAMRRAQLTFDVELLLAQHEGFTHAKPDFLVNISDVVAEKRALMACHRSQLDDAALDAEEARDAFIGTEAWCDAAECFVSFMPPLAMRWGRSYRSILLELTDEQRT